MARGINKVILIGHLGQDPEVKYTAGGMAVTNISVATTESWKDKSSGEKQERTEWHRVSMFGKTAEIAGQYLRKGGQVYIEGRLQTRKWQDKSGADRYTTEIIANDMQMMGSAGGGGGGSASYDNSGGGAPQRNQRPQQQPQPQTSGGGDDYNQDFDDDDIPF